MIWSKYARELLVNAALRGGIITFPATYYVGLLLAAPDIATDAYSELGNVTPNGYARKSVANSSGQWAAPTSTGAFSYNLNDIIYADPSGNWFNGAGPNASEVKYAGLFDSATIGGGNLWFYVPLGQGKKISAGQFNVTLPAGELYLAFDR